MRHFTPEDVIDVLEGGAGEFLVRHAERCDACRALVEDARQARSLAATDEILEPSPLFWTQLSARVAETVRRAPAPQPGRWWADLSWSWSVVPVGSVVVLLLLVAVTQWQNSRQPPTRVARPEAVQPVGQAELWPAPSVEDEPWALVSEAMADLTAGEMSAVDLPATIGSADRALESLSEDEQAELARLLKAEIDDSGPSSE
ncbi:MAG: hypothetical protein NTV05_10135 [Acidobacteria bacterium]|nr:hypothetical protein [Acidobacteriota bacterium]